MHLVLLDPGLQSPIGHHYNFDLGLVEEWRRLGIPHRLFVSREVAPDLAARLGAEAHFDFHPYRQVSEDPLAQDLESYLHLNEVMLKDLIGLASRIDLSDALIVIHTATNRMLWALATWLASGTVPASARLFLVLAHTSGIVGSTATMNAILYRHAFIQLRRVASLVRLTALAGPQAEEFRYLSGLPVELAPYPNPASSWWPAFRTRPKTPHSSCRVLFCGEATGRKGFHLLKDIIRTAAGLRGDVEFVIQINGWHVDADRIREFEDFARGRGDIRIIRGFTAEKDYYELLADTDVVLLPYQDVVYMSQTSAVFEEALYFGRPVVVPPQTSMATELAPLPEAGRVASSSKAEAFAYALVDVIADYPRFAAGAEKAAENRRARSGMDCFTQFLLNPATG